MPTVGDGKRLRREINCAAICALLREQAPIKHPYIEHAAAMPRQGVASMFSLGRTFGADGARRRQHSPHGRHIAIVGRKAVARGRQYRAVAPMN